MASCHKTSVVDGTTCDDSSFSFSSSTFSYNHQKSTKARENESLSDYCSPQKRLRRVSFADEPTLKKFKRIPKVYAIDVWYNARDMERFRSKVLNNEELRLKVKLKSARCHSHMRRVLLEYRVNHMKGATTKCIAARNSLNLCDVSMNSSRKPREAAIKIAAKLEKDIIGDQPASACNPTVSSVCFGPTYRWAFDYYLGSYIDTLCTVMQ